jgi:hypothetical protein
MPVVSVNAKARIATIFIAIIPLQGCLELFGGWRRPDAKQTIAIAVKYPMRSAVIVISEIASPLATMLLEPEKSCSLRHIEIGGEIELFPALGGTAQRHPLSSLSPQDAS